jgi:hypothetical protein
MVQKRHTRKVNDLVDEIIMLRTKKLYSRQNLYKHLTEVLGLGKDNAIKSMHMAEKEFQLRAVTNFREDIQFDIERFEGILQKALAERDNKSAIKALENICKLKGHYYDNSKISEELQKTIEEIRINIKK